MKIEKSENVNLLVMSNSFVTPWTVARQTPLSWDFPGKDTGVVAIPFSRESFRLKDRTWDSCIAGGFFTTEPPGKP